MNGIPYPKWQKKLSLPLNTNEVIKSIDAVQDKEHKAILALLFSSGLRRQEAATLKIDDIDSRNMRITVRMGKGGKDRIVPLSLVCLEFLRAYLRSLSYKPRVYLFERRSGKYISPDTILKICRWYVNAKTHDLRHTFATDLFRNGVQLPIIQEILGHKDIRTTMIYVHVDETMLHGLYNPLDKLTEHNKLRLVEKIAA
jgi:site-specific recombinase XerD